MSTHIKKGVTYSATGEIVSCLFCNIVAGTEPATVITQNDKYIVFKNIRPVSDTAHYLVAPKTHIHNLTSITGSAGAKIVTEMLEIGKESLGPNAHGAQFSFHVPPFNSIDHLHLHCIADPQEMTWVNWLKYGLSFPWCSSAEIVISKLNSETSSN